MTWTRFMDMSSGGGSKEDADYIYIEAPYAEACDIFEERFGHDPNMLRRGLLNQRLRNSGGRTAVRRAQCRYVRAHRRGHQERQGTMTNQQVFARAAEIIREHGWIQGKLHDRTKLSEAENNRINPVQCPHCIMGAIISAKGDFAHWEPLTALSAEVGDYVAWNDTPGRTVEEVLALLDRLAALPEVSP